MRTIRGLSFFVDDEGFAVDITLVQKVARKMKITPVPAAAREIIGIANMKGKVVTILSITALLGAKRNAGTAERDPRTVNAVIFKSSAGSDQMGLVMDRPGDLVEIDENKTSPPPLTEGEGGEFIISGVAESGGILYRIVNINSIIGGFRDSAGYNDASAFQGGTVNE